MCDDDTNVNRSIFHYHHTLLGITIISIILLTPCFVVSIAAPSAYAQIQDQPWTQPLQISNSGMYSEDGYLVSDAYGNLHLVWIERFIDGEYPVIQYARLDEYGWSKPIDIYAPSQGSYIFSLRLAIDTHNELHLTWTETGIPYQRPVFYSHAPAHDAGSFGNWASPQRIDIPADQICLQVGRGGEVLLLYTKHYEPYPGVYYTKILEQGTRWETPERLDPGIPLAHSPADLECASDGLGNYYALWTYAPMIDVGAVNWVLFASYSHQHGWSSPITIDKDLDQSGRLGHAGPRIAVWNQEIHVVWASDIQRLHQYSIDGGQSWSNPISLLLGLEGQAQDSILVDNTGNIHYLAQLRFPRAIYHIRWLGDHWDTPQMVYFISSAPGDPIGDRIHAHHIHAAFRMGNQLFMTFTDPPSELARRLFVVHRNFSDIPTIPALPTPTTEPMPTETLPAGQFLATPTIQNDREAIRISAAPPLTSSKKPVIFLGALPAVLLVFSCIIYFSLIRKKR